MKTAIRTPRPLGHGPVLVQEHTFCECGKVAMYGVFCQRCWDEYSSLQRQWEEKQARLVHPAYMRSAARRRQFFGALIVMLLGEGLWNYAMGVPINFRTFGISLGWALVVALIVLLLSGRKKVSK
jgi:hypothetical protein